MSIYNTFLKKSSIIIILTCMLLRLFSNIRLRYNVFLFFSLHKKIMTVIVYRLYGAVMENNCLQHCHGWHLHPSLVHS